MALPRIMYLNSPNDVVVRAGDGSIYFTDPDYGRWNDWIGCKREFVRDVQGRLPGAARWRRRASWSSPPTSSSNPTVCASPPTSRCCTSTTRRAPRSRPTTSPTTVRLSNCRMFRDGIGQGTMEEGNLDGMECDEHGNIWTSGPGGVWVLDPVRRAHRRHSHARDLRQCRVRRPRSADAVPDHDHLGPPHRDQGRIRPAPLAACTPNTYRIPNP